MAQAGSAYNLHERHKENHVKIGNWVEERALIESAPGMCIPVRQRRLSLIFSPAQDHDGRRLRAPSCSGRTPLGRFARGGAPYRAVGVGPLLRLLLLRLVLGERAVARPPPPPI